MESFDRSLAYFRETNNEASLSGTLGSIGVLLARAGDLSGAIKNFKETLWISEENGMTRQVGSTQNNLGGLYQSMGDYEKAIDFFRKAMMTAKLLNDRTMMIDAYKNMGSCFLALEKPDSANIVIQKGLEIADSLGSYERKAIMLVALGEARMKSSELEKSKVALKEARSIGLDHGNPLQVAAAANQLSQVLFKEGSIDESIEYATEAYETASAIEHMALKMHAAQFLYSRYKERSQMGLALQMFESYTQLKDSTFKEENIKELARFEFKYEYEKKALADSLRTLAENEAIAYNHQVEVAQKETERNL